MSQKRVVCLLLFIAITNVGCLPTQITPNEQSYNSRIVGGETAEPGQFPYQVSIRQSYSIWSHRCGGSIISDRWVITAAHCTPHLTHEYIAIIMGTHHISDLEVRYNTSKNIIHPGFIESFDELRHDIALLQTTETIIFTDKIASIPIKSTFSGAGLTVLSSGWGDLEYATGDGSTYLQHLSLITLTNPDCQSRHVRWAHWVSEDSLCAYSGVRGLGMCGGDSGGPLVHNGELVGIASWINSPCGSGRPDVFTRVSNYLSWINETINEN